MLRALVTKTLQDSSSSSSSSEDDDFVELILARDNNISTGSSVRKRSRHCIQNLYFRDIIHSRVVSEEDFKLHFKITKSSFEELLKLTYNPQVCLGRPPIPLKESLLITLWVLTNQESYGVVSERFKISTSHCVRVFHDTCRQLFKFTKKYIQWPKGQDSITTLEDFNKCQSNNLSNVFGCLGVTHLLIPPSQTNLTYYDQNGNNSILLQAICNCRQEFMHINIGWPGSTHYAAVWADSEVHKQLQSDPDFIPQKSYLVGDTVYPLDKFLLVPFTDNDVLGQEEKLFNTSISAATEIVYRAFGRLKAVFKRLKFLNIVKVDNVKYIATTACILHNISIRDGIQVKEKEIPYLEGYTFEPLDYLDYKNQSATEFRCEVMNELFRHVL